MTSLVEIDLMVLQKKSFRLFHFISAFSYLSPLGKGRGPSFIQTWIFFAQEFFVHNLAEIGQVVLEIKILKFRQCIFTIQ